MLIICAPLFKKSKCIKKFDRSIKAWCNESDVSNISNISNLNIFCFLCFLNSFRQLRYLITTIKIESFKKFFLDLSRIRWFISQRINDRFIKIVYHELTRLTAHAYDRSWIWNTPFNTYACHCMLYMEWHKVYEIYFFTHLFHFINFHFLID
jgi:hypothetical protein